MLAGCADGGDAVSLLQVSAARVEVGKNGLTADGRIPSIEESPTVTGACSRSPPPRGCGPILRLLRGAVR